MPRQPSRHIFKGVLMKYIIALDAGTTSVRAMLYSVSEKKFYSVAQQEIAQSYPNPGWVEQDAGEIYYKCAYVLNKCIRAADEGEIVGIGITNQRESVVFWDRKTGEPVCPAIIWQCRRTSEFCRQIPPQMQEIIREKTGLQTDAYFSASKIKWAIEHIPSVSALLESGNLCVGTIDSYLIYKLTGGKTFATDYTNACRTMLFNIHTLEWDEDLLSYFGVPRAVLPEVKSSTDIMGEYVSGDQRILIAGVAGDQQAALFGQACHEKGDGKITYGTGLFMLFHTGEESVRSKSGLLTTIGYSIGKKIIYALEGSVFNAGSCVQWLRDEMRLIDTSAESEDLATSVPDTGGVRFVPAFTGLGAPYWAGEARGMLCGITRGTGRAHVVRAVLESIAFSAKDLAECMQKDSHIHLKEIRCDGGASSNNFLMQFQADVLGVSIDRPVERESTALGAALLCAIALGYEDENSVKECRKSEKIFYPSPEKERFDGLYLEYKRAVERALR